MDYAFRDTGPGPIIAALCRELGVVDTINNCVEWDEKQCNLNPSTHSLAMIINILCGRTPLYRVEKFFAEQERLSCFVLISNHQSYSAQDILKEYKEQSVVENRFKFVKHPIFVGPLYIQKKERLEALCYVILIALAIYIIMQRRVRRALEQETEPLLLDGKKKSFEPTANKVLALFSSVKILWLKEHGSVKRHLPDRYNNLSRAVQLIGFDMDIFTSPP